MTNNKDKKVLNVPKSEIPRVYGGMEKGTTR